MSCWKSVLDFTYALDTGNGDQFEQFDDRRVYGGQLTWARPLQLMGLSHELDLGFELRRDDIDTVGLYKTVARTRIDTTRVDDVTQSSYSAYSSLKTHWSEHVRTEIGWRADLFDFDVRSSLAENSGGADDSIVSPKFSLILGPWSETELFFNVGKGFHSNDARGTTIRVDPTDGVTPVAGSPSSIPPVIASPVRSSTWPRSVSRSITRADGSAARACGASAKRR